ncbi:MAG: hypothetical protein ACRBCL_05935 [Maritimibacter sp.]
MAYTATVTTNDFASAHPVYARVLEALKNFGTAYVDARSRRSEIEALEAMTDAQLAARGLTRDGITRHVFSDTFYL